MCIIILIYMYIFIGRYSLLVEGEATGDNLLRPKIKKGAIAIQPKKGHRRRIGRAI